jgi:1-deoxy-D-xylulose-5-phosphate reductoisomerase
VAVAAFLDGRIGWIDIAAVCATVLDGHEAGVPADVEDVIEADRRARLAARSVMGVASAPQDPTDA